MVLQPATIPLAPLERPLILNICRRAAPEDRLSNTLYLLGLHGAPIDIMGASYMLRGNSGCGSVRPSPDGPMKSESGPFPAWELLNELLGQDTAMKRASVKQKPVCHVRVKLFHRSPLNSFPSSKEDCGASSTVNQTAMRGLVTNIIHHSSGGSSI
jgi:hypothetical protein